MAPGWLLQAHAFVLWAAGRLTEALCVADDGLARLPQYWLTAGTRMLTLVELGRLAEASREASALRKRLPWLTASETMFTRPIGERAGALRARMTAASITAGLSNA